MIDQSKTAESGLALDGKLTEGKLSQSKPAADQPPPGPGSELKRMLARLGITAKATCKCSRRAAEMDRHGPDWCAANLPTIVGWLHDEYRARKRRYTRRLERHRQHPESEPAPPVPPVWLQLPFSDIAARLLIRRAIRQARQAAR